jgi:hypothetical protein
MRMTIVACVAAAIVTVKLADTVRRQYKLEVVLVF